ncbi:MAG: TadE/TadG family type IV pilus assembly protein [Alphaproteobacteria bacterium]|jgi:Flp pilus assembly protein TadG
MKRFFQQQSGATIIEFAVVAPVVFLLLMGLIEFGRISFTQVAIESATASAAREASIGKAISGDRVQYIKQTIRNKLASALNENQLIISANTVAAGGVTATPDICMKSPPVIGGPCDPPLLFEDVNGNGVYDASVPAVSLGNPGDVIEVRVFYPWSVQIPLMKQFFGQRGVLMLTSSAIVKNEAF